MVLVWIPPRAALRHALGSLGMRSDLSGFVRLNFLGVAVRIGLPEALAPEASAVQVAERLGIVNTDLLETLLDVGVAVGELRRRGGRYALKGKRIRAMAADSGDALRALAVELASYHGSVYHDLPARLAGERLGDYLSEYDDVIARSSRLVEPWVSRFVRSVVMIGNPKSLLEIGCGTGAYLRHVAQAAPRIRGVGIDMSETVVALAAANIKTWQIADRFTVRQADIRSDNPDLPGPYDLITLYNNIYYFAEDERAPLFRQLADRLSPTGRLVLVSLFRDSTVAAQDLDLTLRSTQGCSGLPERTELARALREAGFESVTETRLMPTEPVYGVVAAR